MVFDRLFTMITNSWLTTAYAFLCTIVLCVAFQLIFLKKVNKQEGKPLTIGHFIWVYVFFFYLMLVYRVTGIGTVWLIGFYPELIRMDEIYLMPFGTFDKVISLAPYALNILMTMPLGFLLPLIWKEFRSVKNVALAGFFLSLAIELSQMLNRRITATDDLIANTLGAVAGYFIFMLLFKIFRRDSEFKPKSKHRSPFLRHEAVIYLICSFMGVFLFYNGFFIDRINDSIKYSNNENGTVYDFDADRIITGNTGTQEPENTRNSVTGAETNKDIDEIKDVSIIKGVVLQVNENTIKIEKADSFEIGDVSIMGSKGEEMTVFLTKETVFETSQTNAAGTSAPVISQGNKNDVVISGNVEIHVNYEGESIIAEKILIIKFGGR